MSQYSADALINAMKLLGYLPTASGLTTEQILRLMTDEMGLYIPALLKSIREEYLVATLDITVTAATVSVPERACGAALRTIAWVDADGSEFQLDRIEPERRGDYGATATTPAGYMFRDNSVVLVPAVTSGTLRVAYQQRPGRLVLEEDCGLITDINAGSGEVTVEAAPDTFTSDDVYDLLSATPNFDLLAMDQEASVAGSVLTFTDTLPAGLAEGDFVCLAGETCIPQMPYELHTVLAQRTAYKLAEATGSARAPAIGAGLTQARADVIALLSPRSDGSARPIISRSGVGRRWW